MPLYIKVDMVARNGSPRGRHQNSPMKAAEVGG